MAFRKTRRKSFRFRKPVARKRTTWVESLVIDPCNPLRVPFCAPTDGCCTTKWKMILMDQNTMQGLFSDRLSVVRIVGNLWIVPDPNLFAASPLESYDRLRAISAECFFGLKRGETTTQSASATSDIWDPTGTDLSEFQWMKTWAHRWEAFDGFGIESATNTAGVDWTSYTPVVRPDTHTFVVPGVTACNPMATGTGDICIETTFEEECVGCLQGIPPFALNMFNAKLLARPNWHVSFDIKKKIPMRENQELYLMFNGRNPSTAPFDDFAWQIKGNLRALVQMG